MDSDPVFAVPVYADGFVVRCIRDKCERPYRPKFTYGDFMFRSDELNFVSSSVAFHKRINEINYMCAYRPLDGYACVSDVNFPLLITKHYGVFVMGAGQAANVVVRRLIWTDLN